MCAAFHVDLRTQHGRYSGGMLASLPIRREAHRRIGAGEHSRGSRVPQRALPQVPVLACRKALPEGKPRFSHMTHMIFRILHSSFLGADRLSRRPRSGPHYGSGSGSLRSCNTLVAFTPAALRPA